MSDESAGTMKRLRALQSELEGALKLSAVLLDRLGGTCEILVEDLGQMKGAIAVDRGQMPDGRVVMRLRLLKPEAPQVEPATPAELEELKRRLGLH